MYLIHEWRVIRKCVNAVSTKQTYRRPLEVKTNSSKAQKRECFQNSKGAPENLKMSAKRLACNDCTGEDAQKNSLTNKNTGNPSKRVKKDAIGDIEDSHQVLWRPEHWELVLENIRAMRSKRDAPVDSMGAEKCADQNAPPEVRRFQILVSLMLSSQTKDQITYAAMENLKKHGLTIAKIMETDEKVIAELIHPVGFWKKKASYIKRTAAILHEKFNNDIPKTVEEMCKHLPGVGQKMAVLTVNIAWNTTVGIGVDIHVHRISNRLGWSEKPTKTPEQTQIALEKWMPAPLWGEINLLMVGFGQQICTPVKPNCSKCLNVGHCQFGKSNKLA